MSDDVKVEEVLCTLPESELWGSFRVKSTEGNRLELVGWVLGVGSEVTAVEILARGAVVAKAVPNLPRPDLAEQIPDREDAATCGFAVVIEGEGKGESLLRLQAVLEAGDHKVPMGQVRVTAPTRRWSVFRR